MRCIILCLTLIGIFLRSSSATEPVSIYSLDQKWIGHHGKELSINSLGGKLAVITMIFTSCPGVCPMMVSNMKKFDNELSLKEKEKINYYVFSLDSKRDTPEVLANYVNKMGLDSRWTMFTSKEENVRELSVTLGFSYKRLESGDFTHSTNIYLISEKGEILSEHKQEDGWSDFLSKIRIEQNKK